MNKSYIFVNQGPIEYCYVFGFLGHQTLPILTLNLVRAEWENMCLTFATEFALGVEHEVGLLLTQVNLLKTCRFRTSQKSITVPVKVEQMLRVRPVQT